MLIEFIMSVACILIALCGWITFVQFRQEANNAIEDQVAESMAARSNRIVLDLADAYQMPDEMGMVKVEAVRKAKQSVLEYESDFYLTVEERECGNQDGNVFTLRARS